MRNALRLAIAWAALGGRAFAGAPDAELIKVANWFVGSFDNRAQVKKDETLSPPAQRHEATSLTVRPLQDPVVFADGLYTYVELSISTPGGPQTRQRIFRFKKGGGRIRVEVLKIDGHVSSMLSADPQMLGNLAPADLVKEDGCDLALELRGGEYVGSTNSRSCRAEKGAAYRQSTLQISQNRIVMLDREYDEKGTLMSGPPDATGNVLERIQP